MAGSGSSFRPPALRVVGGVGFGLLLAALGAASGATTPVDAVQRCIRANVPPLSLVQEVEVAQRDAGGAAPTQQWTVLWKRFPDDTRTLIRVNDPPYLRGSAYLLIEQRERLDTFVYLPEFRKVRRLASSAVSTSLFGTDLSDEDVRMMRALAEHPDTALLPEGRLAERPVHVLESRPRAETRSAFRRIVAQVDRDTCYPLDVAFYGDRAEAAKRVAADAASLEQRGGRWFARRVVVRDLERGTETRLAVRTLEVDVALPDRTFTTSGLAARGH